AFVSYNVATSTESMSEMVDLSIRGIECPIRLRRNTSDFDVFRQIFLCRQYALRLAGPVEYIVDAGANIGLASLYLLRRFPRARVVAVEPDTENLEIARHNLRAVSERCQLVHGAVWPTRAVLGVSRACFLDGRHWSTQTLQLDGRAAISDIVPAF